MPRCHDPIFLLRTRPLVGEEGEEVGGADVAVAVEQSKNPRPVKAGGVMVVTTRRGSVTRLRTRPPGAQQEEQILHAHVAAVVEVRRAGGRADFPRLDVVAALESTAGGEDIDAPDWIY